MKTNQTTTSTNGNLFPNLLKALCEKNKAEALDKISEINKVENLESLNHWSYRDLLPASKKITDFKTLDEAKSYLIKRVEKRTAKAILNHESNLIEISKAPDFNYFNISVEWKRSQMWGSNPTGDGYDYNGRYLSGSIGGCGYDKLSTAVANVLNQSKALTKLLYLYREKDTSTNLRELFGYGSGYGILPRFEGGVGVGCYPEIFLKLGFKFRQTGSGKMYDSFEVTKLEA